MTPQLEKLEREIASHRARRMYYHNPPSKLEKRLEIRRNQEERVSQVCGRLRELVNLCQHGKYFHISLNDNVHELIIRGESLGCVLSLHEITDKLPVFIDNVPDYVYNAQVAGMSYKYDGKYWTESVTLLAKSILSAGGSDKLWSLDVTAIDDAAPITYPLMMQGKIPLQEALDYLKRDAAKTVKAFN